MPSELQILLVDSLVSRVSFRYACEELGGLGERLVALCDYRLPPRKYPPGFQFNSSNINFPLSGFRLVGLMSLMDPPRPTVPDAVAKCQAAGIKVIMIRVPESGRPSWAYSSNFWIIKNKCVFDKTTSHTSRLSVLGGRRVSSKKSLKGVRPRLGKVGGM